VKQKSFIYLLLLIQILLLSKCNSVDPPPPPNEEKPTLTLEFEDASCIEAWIKLSTTNLQLPASIALQQNDQKRKTINLVKADTLIYVDSLLPNTSYQYQVSSIEYQVSSNELGVTTMDTTSHDFTFETFMFGGSAGSSTLYDVAIIDENNIWAVGEILVADTSVNGYTTYNAIHWDGSQWELKRITVDFRGNLITPPLEGVFAFSNTDIWFVGSLPVHGDGENWIMYDLRTTVDPNITVSKAWGSSSNDMYFVGRNGNIARYLNGTWRRIESGTTTDINDVWGVVDNDGFEKIYCAVSFVFQSGDQKILIIENNKVDSLSWNTGRRLHSIWTNNNFFLYTAGGGIFENKRGYWNEVTKVPLYYSNNIRGTGNNNIFVCGDFGLFAHYNGSEWKTFNEIYIQGIYYAVAVKNNIVITVGFEGSSAIIVKGIRN
jgi:hypothetical protein